MKCMLELTVSAVVVLAVAAGCGGSSSDNGGGTPSAGASAAGASTVAHAGASSASGGASSSAGGAPSTSGGASSTTGGASTTPGAPFTTSVPATATIGSLTGDQLTQICSDVQKFVDSTLDPTATNYECQSFALVSAASATSDADAQTACQASLASCTPNPPTTPAMCTPSDPTCMATVGEATTCFNDLNAALQSATSTLPSCNGITVAKATAALAVLAGGTGTVAVDPPSCTKLDMECPGSSMLPPMN